MAIPRKPRYELPALRDGLVEIKAKIKMLYNMLTDETKAGIMPYIEKEKARQERFENLIRQHEEYEAAMREHIRGGMQDVG